MKKTKEEKIREKAEKKGRKNKFFREDISLKKPEDAEADYSLWKIIAVIAVTAASAALFGLTLSHQFSLSRVFGAGLLFAAFITIQPLLIKDRNKILFSVFLSVISLFLPLFLSDIPFFSPVFFSVMAASFIFLVWGQLSGKEELDNALRIRFSKLSGRVLSKSLTAIALTAAIVFGWSFNINTLFSEKFINSIIDISKPVIGYYVPNFDPAMNFRDFLAVSAKQTLAGNNVVEFNLMPETLKNQLINQTVENSRRSLENNFGINIDLDLSFSENVRNAITEKLKDPASLIPADHLSIAAAIIIFLIARGTLWIFSWLVAALSFFVYQTLLAISFAEVTLETRSKEVILLK